MERKANKEGRTIFVCRLDSRVPFYKFAHEMNRAGEIEVCHIGFDPKTLRHMAFGFVSYVHKCDADWAVWHNDFEIDGCQLLIRPYFRPNSSIPMTRYSSKRHRSLSPAAKQEEKEETTSKRRARSKERYFTGGLAVPL